jgi:hypothetical protein
MDWHVQTSTWTATNRYPGIFRTVQCRVAQCHGQDLGGARLRILSFGCSNGMEVLSLRGYFPEAIIFACDVNLQALREAAETLAADEAVLFVSSEAAIAAHGPFDVIFAMSVLCRFPESADRALDNLSPLYSFDAFAAAAGVLARNLDRRGLLCIYNANYDFLATPAAHGFRPIRSPLVPSRGFVDRFGQDGKRLTLCQKLGPYYAHRVSPGTRPVDEPGFSACIFELAGDNGTGDWVAFGEVPPPHDLPPPACMRFGPDLDSCARSGLIANALGTWFVDDDPAPMLVRAWFQSSAEGTIVRGQPWVVRAGPAAAYLATANRDPLPPVRLSLSRQALHVATSAGRRLRDRLARVRPR